MAVQKLFSEGMAIQKKKNSEGMAVQKLFSEGNGGSDGGILLSPRSKKMKYMTRW